MTRGLIGIVLGVAVVLPAAALLLGAAPQIERARAIPAPAVQEAAPQATTEVAVLAGGCFWGVQAVFQQVTGVTGAVSGYAGGKANTAKYDLVGRAGTGHAEAVQVTFDPRKISYSRLLQVFFSVAHNPTQLNRQGPDVGHQYRSAIFPTSAEQARIAQEYIAQLNQARVFKMKVVTTIEPDRPFYLAEPYHQDYLHRHRDDPYILMHDLPKLAELKELFPALYRPTPVLVFPR
jgi:peptide-methionine (S)-S-oxide reductase